MPSAMERPLGVREVDLRRTTNVFPRRTDAKLCLHNQRRLTVIQVTQRLRRCRPNKDGTADPTLKDYWNSSSTDSEASTRSRDPSPLRKSTHPKRRRLSPRRRHIIRCTSAPFLSVAFADGKFSSLLALFFVFLLVLFPNGCQSRGVISRGKAPGPDNCSGTNCCKGPNCVYEDMDSSHLVLLMGAVTVVIVILGVVYCLVQRFKLKLRVLCCQNNNLCFPGDVYLKNAKRAAGKGTPPNSNPRAAVPPTIEVEFDEDYDDDNDDEERMWAENGTALGRETRQTRVTVERPKIRLNRENNHRPLASIPQRRY